MLIYYWRAMSFNLMKSSKPCRVHAYVFYLLFLSCIINRSRNWWSHIIIDIKTHHSKECITYTYYSLITLHTLYAIDMIDHFFMHFRLFFISSPYIYCFQHTCPCKHLFSDVLLLYITVHYYICMPLYIIVQYNIVHIN